MNDNFDLETKKPLVPDVKPIIIAAPYKVSLKGGVVKSSKLIIFFVVAVGVAILMGVGAYVAAQAK